MNAKIFWFTGLSGAGKTTICEALKPKLEEKGLKVTIIDGDVVRERYKTPIGFSFEEVKLNNLNIVKIILDQRHLYDVILVPVISPYDEVRRIVADMLMPNFYLVHCNASVDTVKMRDTKGLYKKESLGIINNLIGISVNFEYDIPQNPALTLNTNSQPLYNSVSELYNFILKLEIQNEATKN